MIVAAIALPLTLLSVQAGTLTVATGGGAISADTTGGAYTALTGPIYAEAASGEVDPGTLALNAPNGFVFDTGGTAPAVVLNRISNPLFSRQINNLSDGDTIPVAVTATTLTITITASSSGGGRSRLTWQNIRVRPAAGTPLASGTIKSSGTSIVTGVTHGTTSWGSLTEVVGARAKLGVATEPSSSATAGVAFAEQPVVQVQDQFGTLISSDTAAVTAARFGGSGTLQGTLTSSATAGVASFSNLFHTVAGVITIQFTSPGLTADISQNITINPAAPNRLNINTQPSAMATAGTVFAQQPVVHVLDQYLNLVTWDNSSVVSAARNAGAGTLQGTVMRTAASGIVSFTDLKHLVAGTITIVFTSPGLTGQTSSSITINPAGVSELFLTTQPSPNATAGVAFVQQPVLQLRDAFGNVVTGDSTTVVTVVRSSGSGTLQGLLTATASSGVVTFAGLHHLVANTINLSFSATGVSAVTSASITIAPAAAHHLAFTTQPGAAVVDLPFGVQPVVQSFDQYENLSSVGLAASQILSVSLSAGSGALQGGTTRDIGTAAGSGTATFTDLAIDTVGTGKVLTANVPGLIGAASEPFEVTKGTQVITFPPIPDKTYGDPPFNLNATSSAGLPITYTLISGSVMLSGSTVTITNVGEVTIRASQPGNANYEAADDVDQTFTINPAALTITADNKSKTYGDPVPALTATYSGLVNGDTPGSLGTAPTLSTTATQGSTPGTYPITVTGASDPRYTITFVNGTLTIARAPLTITIHDKTKVYGAAHPEFTASYTGFISGESEADLDTALTYTTVPVSASVGMHPITGSAGDANYLITFVDGSLTISPATLTITADDRSKVYGAALPTLTATYTGLVNGDTPASLDTPLLLSTTASASSDVGNYPITASGAADPNYTITLADGVLTVTRALLTIRADNKVKIFEEPVPPLTATYIGLVNGDTSASLDSSVVLATTATQFSAIGRYPITVSGAADSNYTIAFVNGTLTITGRRVDALMLYTSAARLAAGNRIAMEAQIVSAMAEANLALANSLIDVELNAIKVAEINYTESGNATTDLARLIAPADSQLDAAHALREQWGADIVVLIAENLGTSSGASTTMRTVSSAFREQAFVVVKRSTMLGTSNLAHEIGHIFGAEHDRANATQSGAYDFSHGYEFSSGGTAYRTVMSEGAGTRIAHFSNPNVQYNGVATGVSAGFANSANNALTIKSNAATVAAFSDEAAVFSFDYTATNVTETSGSATLTILRAGAASGEATVVYTTRGGSATGGSDYTASTLPLIFANGEGEKSITIPILNDSQIEPNEVFEVVLLSATNGLVGMADTAQITIEDDEVGLRFASAAYAVNEQATNVVVEVIRTGDPSVAAAVQYAASNGVAVAGQDYTASTGTLSFDPGVTNRTITIAITDDNMVENNETFSLALSNASGSGVIVPPTNAIVTILENDSAFVVTTNAATIAESAATVLLAVTRNGNTNTAGSVQIRGLSGTATADADFRSTNITLSFGPGVRSQSYSISLINDNAIEGNETFSAVLTNAVNGSVGAPSIAGVTILDNDSGFEFSTNTVTVSEATPSLTLNVIRTGGIIAPATVRYATASGAAVSPGDFTARSGTLSFKAGESNKPIVLTIKNDTVLETDETFTVRLSNPTGDGSLGTRHTINVTIRDNDSLLSWATNEVTVFENAGVATLSIRRTGALTETNIVNYSLRAGTAGTKDYTVRSGKVTIPPGATNTSLTVPIVNDTEVEPPERFGVQLSRATGGGMISGTNTTYVNIAEDDIGLTFSAPSYAVLEDSGAVIMTVVQRGNTNATVSVNFNTSNIGAIAGTDYTQTNGVLSFGPGTNSLSVVVPIIDDSALENDEDFNVILSGASAGVKLLGKTTMPVKILEDDAAFTLNTNIVAALENAAGVTLIVLRVGGTNLPASVDFMTMDTTATQGDDYRSTNGTFNFIPGQNKRSVFIPFLNDGSVEGDEEVRFVLTNITGAVNGSITSAVVRIRDNDSVFSFTGATASVAENARTLPVRIIRSGGVAGAARVRAIAMAGTASATTDFKLFNQQLSFKAGETNKTIYLTIVDNTLTETNETFSFTLTMPTDEATLDTNVLTVTIIDNDVGVGGEEPDPFLPDMFLTTHFSQEYLCPMLCIYGPIGLGVVIESSSDLLTWAPFVETSMTAVPLLVPAQSAFTDQLTFYRVREASPTDGPEFEMGE